MKTRSYLVEDGAFTYYPLSDVHWPIHDKQKLERWAETVDQDKTARFTLGGDLCDMLRTTARSYLKGYTADENSWEPIHNMARSQAEDFATFLRPLREKLLGAVAGNHHYRFPDGRVTDQLVCEYLAREDAWLGAFGLIRMDLSFGPFTIPCKIALHHDAGKKGGTLPSDVRVFEHWSHVVDADIYAAGHTHRAYTMAGATCITVPDQGAAEIADVKRIFVRSGSFLKTYPESPSGCKDPYVPEYAVEKMLPPSVLSIQSIGVHAKASGKLAFDLRQITL